MVNDFLELPSDQLAIYLVGSEGTFVKRASDTEVQEMYEYGIDLFSTLKHSERYRTLQAQVHTQVYRLRIRQYLQITECVKPFHGMSKCSVNIVYECS